MDDHGLLLVLTNLRNQFQAGRKERWKKKLANLSFELEGHLKGHCHGNLASFYNGEICSCINGNPNIMMQFCYRGRCHCTETIYRCLSLSMTRMEMIEI